MSSASASGTVFATESYVHIEWAWLTFLAIQVALAISFLLGIIVQTAVWNVKVLKGSPTAALFALSAESKAYLEEEQAPIDSSGGSGQGARRLQNTTCRFRPGERGWTLEVENRGDA